MSTLFVQDHTYKNTDFWAEPLKVDFNGLGLWIHLVQVRTTCKALDASHKKESFFVLLDR